MKDLFEYVDGQIWIKEYPIHYAGLDFPARMTVVRLLNGNLLIHSPCDIDEATKQAIDRIGKVDFIVAPGSYHYFHVASAQRAFPDAETFICPGVERKVADIEFDWILGDRTDDRLASDFEQVLIRGNSLIWEVAFFHKATRTLVLVDSIEYVTDQSEGTDWKLKIWWKLVFRMWNKPKPAPEYQMGWSNKTAAKKSFQRIMEWPFERIVIAHGDLIEEDAKDHALRAWQSVLEA